MCFVRLGGVGGGLVWIIIRWMRGELGGEGGEKGHVSAVYILISIESIPVDIGEQEIRFSGMQNPSTPVTPWVLVTATMVSDIKLLGMRAGYLTMFIRTFTVQEVRIMDGLVVVMDVDGGRDVGGLRMEDGEFELWWSLAKGGWQR